MDTEDRQEGIGTLLTVNPPRFFGPRELAERWGLTRQRISQLVAEGKLAPGEQLAGGRVWTLAEIVDCETRSGRTPRFRAELGEKPPKERTDPEP